ncbi:amidase [Hirschia litorea]|uniref:Amidase n=1 Tax=Hirschia litorea TaxID=1199156 RepID=A0ABW2IJR3_9PROT
MIRIIKKDETFRGLSSVFVSALELGDGDVSVGIKDVIDVAGVQTRVGSRALANVPPALENAEIVELILNSGMKIVGKTNMHELAYGVTGLNDYTGTPTNPNYPEIIPGGSSSGSAVAVAAGAVDWAVGTDTGGSIRVPAACCGVLGLKPTFGRVSRRGLLPEFSSLDCPGPLASEAKYIDVAMRALAPDWKLLSKIGDLKVAYLEVEAQPDIYESVLSVLLGFLGRLDKYNLKSFSAAHSAGLTVISFETHSAFKELLGTEAVGIDVASRLKLAEKISSEDILEAEKVRETFTAEVDAAFEQYDLLALPTLPIFPPKVLDADDLMRFLNITALTRPFNLSGHPAISIPMPSVGGYPIGLQLIAPKNEDEKLVSFAREFEASNFSRLISKI